VIGRFLSLVGHELLWVILGILIGVVCMGFEPWRPE
jgi:hypothetical protein